MPVDPASTLLGAGPMGAVVVLLLYQLRETQRELSQVSKETAKANKELAQTLSELKGYLEGRIE